MADSTEDSLRHRAKALAKAFYYTECSLNGISSANASAAEENVLCNQSKWWLQGDDPNHPSLQLAQKPTTSLHPAHLHDVIAKPAGEEVKATSMRSTEEEREVQDNPFHHDDQGEEEDWDAPIFAHDNDYPSDPVDGFEFKRKTARSNGSFSVAATGSTLPPDCLQCPLDSTYVLRSYSAYPNHYFRTSDDTPLSRSVAHPITSESEADDSLYISEMSHDESSASAYTNNVTTSRHMHQGKRKRLRVSLDKDATLDETFLQAKVDRAKKDLLSSLEDSASELFSESLNCLSKAGRQSSQDIDGTWIMISPPPDYPSCLGTNGKGDKLYTLERMSFGMYQPGALLCSIQQQFNTISSVKSKADMPQYVPSSLKKEVENESGKCSGRMKTYK